jgi:serine/threonine protein phosphatase PrpC
VAVRVQCSHCQGFCLVEEQYLGALLKCGYCAQTFVAPTARSDVRAASEEGEEIGVELDGPEAETSWNPMTAEAVSTTTTCRLELGAATSRGVIRARNEDSFLTQHLTWSNLDQRRELALIVVADGMGGYDAGDRASGLTIQSVATTLSILIARILAGEMLPPAMLAETIATGCKEANRMVIERAQADPSCKGMGATAAVVLVLDGDVQIGHVGDCRVYHQHRSELTQVTRDQTLVMRMVEVGTLSPQEAVNHPARNEVTQAIGKHPDLAPGAYQLRLECGDWLIVACDGLHAHVDAKQLAQAISESAPCAMALAQKLVERADQGGGSDNCTVVAVRCY